MYGEMVSVRARATALKEMADELNERAKGLHAQCEAMAWRSSAGDAFRDQLRGLAGDIGSHVSALEGAAAALERHASAVEGTKRAIQDAQAWVTARLNEAVRTARDAGDGVVDALESAVISTSRNAPAPGSREWLDFRQLFERRGWV
jgi:uncharacterized protein YukE